MRRTRHRTSKSLRRVICAAVDAESLPACLPALRVPVVPSCVPTERRMDWLTMRERFVLRCREEREVRF